MKMPEIRKEFRKMGLSVDFCGKSANIRCYRLHWITNGSQNGDVYSKANLLQYLETMKADQLIQKGNKMQFSQVGNIEKIKKSKQFSQDEATERTRKVRKDNKRKRGKDRSWMEE